MKSGLLVAAVFAASVACSSTGHAQAQNYPAHTVKIVTAPTGGGTDFVSRVIAPELQSQLDQTVYVDNQATLPGITAVAHSAPDGYSLIVMGLPLWTTQFLQNISWDPIKDFTPISIVTSQSLVLVVNPTSPINSVQQLIDLAKASPGKLNIGSAGLGSSPDIAARLFLYKTGVNLVTVEYNGSGPAVTALLGNEVQVSFATPASVSSLIKNGSLRAIAVTDPKPSPLFPTLPTVSATVPGFNVVEVLALLAPGGTPAPVVDKLSAAMQKILAKPEVQQKFLTAQLETGGGTPADLLAKINSDIANFGPVLTAAMKAAAQTK